MTKKYEVIRPWFGVEKGQIVTEVGAMFKANVREVTAKIEEDNDLKKENKALKSKIKELENQLTESLGRIVELESKGADKK